jgi:2-polyprenyl-3-methyl-5-hydroxy-6-metoxy-1,4-benzoquinol methylase
MATIAQQQPSTFRATSSMPAPNVTPERFFNAINAHQQTAAMKAAVELDVFTAIAEGNATASTIASRCKTAERGARILCDFLTINGFLTKTGQQYGLAPDAALFLNRHSPAYLGGAIEFLLTDRLIVAHQRLTDAVRLGGTALGQGTLEPENPDWVKFAEAMGTLAAMPAQIIAAGLCSTGATGKVLDIAAGHGMYGIAVAKNDPTAHVYAADWKNVLTIAEKNARVAGVSERYHLLPGDAFNVEFGNDFDLVLIPNFLHHFDPPTCTAFLRKVNAALKPGGRVAIVEFAPNPDRVTPPTAAAFSMMMLATTPSGDAHPVVEYEKMAKDAGFTRLEVAPIEPGLEQVLVATK